MKKKILLLFFVLLVMPGFAQCWKSVSVGYANAFAIADNGTLWAWGKNTNGELGDGTNVNKNIPVQVGTANDWKEVFAGMDGIYAFTLAVKTDGTLWAWGSNNRGQLGDGTAISKNYPVQVGTDTDWKTAAAGLNHSIAIKLNGTLWGWGCSEHFALIGFPSGEDVLVPEQRSTDTDWVQVSAHDRVTVAVKANNTVWGWGYNRNNMLEVPSGATLGGDTRYPAQKIFGTNIRKTTTGDRTSIDIKTNNILANSGDPLDHNPLYVLDADVGYNTTAILKPNHTLWYEGKVLGSLSQVTVGLTQLGTAANWTAVSVGNQCAAALNADGEIWTWGANFHGGLGNGTSGVGFDSTTLVKVSCPSLLGADQFPELSFQLYPNPAKSTVKLQSDVVIDRLIITDVLGKEYFNQRFNSSTIDVDISLFAKGLYIVQAFSGQSRNHVKMLKD